MEIKIEELSYKGLFKNISIKFKSGQISSLVGKNGSGKTTLLNYIYMLDRPEQGKIKISKKQICPSLKKIEKNKLRKDMFYIMQTYENQFAQSNILKDIKFLSGKKNGEIIQLLSEFKLEESILKKSYLDLSSGELKKIIIISMILSDSKIILIDEPTLGLDEKGQLLILKWLKKLKRDGKLILITSTNSEFLLKISDQIYAINNEKICFYDDKNGFFDNALNLNKVSLQMPNTYEFRSLVLNNKNIKLPYQDNVNDLIKDVYRNVK